MKIIETAQTAALARQTAGSKKAMEAGYTKRHPGARHESTVVERQIRWCIDTLRNPGIRSNERICVLLLVGGILLDYLSQQPVGVGT